MRLNCARLSVIRSPRGFTLTEVLVASAISLVLAVLLVHTYSQGKSAVELSSGRIALQQRTRLAIDRITPIVVTAVESNGQPAVNVVDLVADPTDAAYLEITTTEDFLAPAYDPDAAFIPITATVAHIYRIRFDPDAGELWLEKLLPDRSGVDFSVQPRLLANKLTGVAFNQPFTSAVEVRVLTSEQVRRADRTTDTIEYEARSVLMIPYYSSGR